MHKFCTRTHLPKTIRHPLHQRHGLILTRWVGTEGNVNCKFCWDDLEDSIGYSCEECEFKLDKKCVSLVAKTYEFHGHPLVLSPTLRLFSCDKCRCRECVPMLHCVDEDCRFSLHIHCVPSLPPVVKYEGHIHCLNLTNAQIKDHDDEEGYEEFYCDACEELRLLPDPTYCCGECHYVAHVRCLISDEEVLAQGEDLELDLGLVVSIPIDEGSVEEQSGDSKGLATTKLEKEIESEIQLLTVELDRTAQEKACPCCYIALCLSA